MVRVDVAALRQTLVFAFAMGGSVESFEEALASASLPPSGWDRAHFARDLFLEELVTKGFPVRIGGRAHRVASAYLLRVLSEPPRAAETLAFRRAVLEELGSSPARRGELERVYGEIVRLRTLLCAERAGVRWLRRLEILRSVHQVFAVLAASFAGAASGLARLPAFGAAVCEGEAYLRLGALLEHEEHLGTVDLRVRVGADGELRTFQIVAVRENSHNPFYSSPLGRLWARLRLLLRGYRMNGGEVLERLFDDVFTGLEASLALVFQLVGDVELYLAALGFRDRAEERGLAVCLPDLVEPVPMGAPAPKPLVPMGAPAPKPLVPMGAPAPKPLVPMGAPAPKPPGEGGMVFRGIWNPLLLGEKTTPVPCDLSTAEAASVVIVTGPNSGGKTRLLQALAIAQLLGEAGLFVPAAAARMPRVSGLFVSLVEESRADQPEGQLGMELMRIRRMFEQLGMGSLVLLDELCSGTNPSEGEEIARLVISLLPELYAQVFVTTHLLQFAARLAEERPIPRLEFFQVELDEGDRPTYGFSPGVARTSLAQKTAARLGVTRDDLLALIARKKRAPALPGSVGRAAEEAAVTAAAESSLP
jgi:DNA mismatch repair protein MutS2